jgi:hypothetical protein
VTVRWHGSIKTPRDGATDLRKKARLRPHIRLSPIPRAGRTDHERPANTAARAAMSDKWVGPTTSKSRPSHRQNERSFIYPRDDRLRQSRPSERRSRTQVRGMGLAVEAARPLDTPNQQASAPSASTTCPGCGRSRLMHRRLHLDRLIARPQLGTSCETGSRAQPDATQGAINKCRLP